LWASALHPESLCVASKFHEFVATEFPIAIFVKTHRHVDKVFGTGPIHPRPKSAWAFGATRATKATRWALRPWTIGGLSKT